MKDLDVIKVLGIVLLGMAMAIVMAIMSGCRSKKVALTDSTTRIEVRHDTIYKMQFIKDSTKQRDSVFVERFVIGDTVYMNKYKEVYLYRDRSKTDTLYKAKTDTIYKERELIKTVEKVKKRFNFGDVILFGIGLLSLLWLGRELLNKLKK